MLYVGEEFFHEYNDTYIVNGYIYFKYPLYYPEVSGWYEVLFSHSSSSYLSVRNGVIKPYLFFDDQLRLWKFDKQNSRKINQSSIIGWRDYLIEVE